MSNERDAFSLYISYITYLDNNKLAEIIYRSVGFQILRLVRTTSNLINMVPPVNLFDTIRMKKQGNEYTRIILLPNKIFGKHFVVFLKSTNNADEFIKFLSFGFIHICACVCIHLYANVCKCIFSVYFMFCRCVYCILFRYIT